MMDGCVGNSDDKDDAGETGGDCDDGWGDGGSESDITNCIAIWGETLLEANDEPPINQEDNLGDDAQGDVDVEPGNEMGGS